MDPEPGINILVGRNGAGKTNFLEGVCYLSTLRSFRRVPDGALVGDGAEAFVLRGSVDRGGDQRSTVAVEVPRSGRRRVEVNGKAGRAARELPEHLRVVVFSPDDLDVVKRGPAGRRELIDDLAEQLWPAARSELADYERALRQRTALLRRFGPDTDDSTLEVWDEKVSHSGAKVFARRAGTLGMLEKSVSETYSHVAGQEWSVVADYRSSWGGDPSGMGRDEVALRLVGALGRARQVDKERRVTTVGPHRDDPGWLLDGRDTRTHISQGEQRTLALALRLASRQAILELTGGPPVLLLDDVFSELDLERAEALAQVLPEGQSFITTTREEEVPVSGRRWEVSQGELS